uniref:Uncharacterized protein n=1 Tax=Nelumbo nucifera TaxID=4432 RepID=A0A822XG21_NELNU|nr:TPA_asm: hypothetical protein HUJ06_019429 [Nelumbo nucifera]
MWNWGRTKAVRLQWENSRNHCSLPSSDEDERRRTATMTNSDGEQCDSIYSPLFSSPDTGRKPLFIAFPIQTEAAVVAREPGSGNLKRRRRWQENQEAAEEATMAREVGSSNLKRRRQRLRRWQENQATTI